MAGTMLGTPTAFTRLPFFYSDQYEFGMEYRGHAGTWDQVVFRGDPASREFLAFWLHQGRVLAAMNANIWDQGDTLDALLRSRRHTPAPSTWPTPPSTSPTSCLAPAPDEMAEARTRLAAVVGHAEPTRQRLVGRRWARLSCSIGS